MWLIIGVFVFLIWCFVLAPFNIGFTKGLMTNKEPVFEDLLIGIMGPFALIIPIFFFLFWFGEFVALILINLIKFNRELEKEE